MSDLIKRADAIKAITSEPIDAHYPSWYVDKLKGVPSAEPKGRWVEKMERHFLDSRVNVGVEMKEATGNGYHTYVNLQCTNCNKITMVDKSILYNYCPHCGAKMEASE